MKSENRALRGDEGAAGGHDYYTSNELHSQRLAQELKAAASTAEHSLRLVSGVLKSTLIRSNRHLSTPLCCSVSFKQDNPAM